MTNHCCLEMAGILPTDECCVAEDSTTTSGDPCDTECKLVEKTGYKTETNQKIQVVVPFLISLLASSPEQFSNSVSANIHFWPPDALHLPQFLITTSLPIRGPSLVS